MMGRKPSKLQALGLAKGQAKFRLSGVLAGISNIPCYKQVKPYLDEDTKHLLDEASRLIKHAEARICAAVDADIAKHQTELKYAGIRCYCGSYDMKFIFVPGDHTKAKVICHKCQAEWEIAIK